MFQNNLLMGAAAASSGGASLVSVGGSALFTAINQSLSRTQVAGSNTVWTFSSWVFKCSTKNQVFLNFGTSGAEGQLGWNASDQLYIYNGAATVGLTTKLFRDIGWYHIHLAYNTGLTGVSKVKLSVNGELVTAWATDNRASASAFEDANQNTQVVRLGNNSSDSGTVCLDGYMAETVILDGTASSATNFGQYDSSGLYWTPKSSDDIKALTFGNNGVYLDNTTNPQTDASGEGHNYTNNNSVTTNTHSPTNSAASLNPLSQSPSSGTMSLANTRYAGDGGGYIRSGVMTTLPCDSGGKWYWETRMAQIYTTNAYSIFGVSPSDLPRSTDSYATSPGNTNFQGGQLYFSGSSYTYLKANAAAQNDNVVSSMTISVGSIVQLAFDATTQKLWYGINNTWYNSGDPANGTNPSSTFTATDKTWYPWFGPYTSSDVMDINMGSNPTFNGTVTAQNNADGNGEGNFYYSPPTGFLAINTANIASETTRTASDTTKYFDTILYEGNGDGQRVGQFQPFGNAFTVAKSALFDDANSESLTRAFSTPSSANVWTFSTWLKRSALSTGVVVVFGGTYNRDLLLWNGGDNLHTMQNGVTGIDFGQTLEDSSQWFHVVWSQNGTTTIGYINGVQVATDTETNDTINESGITHYIGNRATSAAPYDGYMAETVFIDGSALTPSSFGQTDTSTNRWIPKDVSGLTFGNNGFYLNYANSSDVGNDVSGNNNDWTNNNTVLQVADSPTTNANVWNPSESAFGGGTFSNGNRTVVTGSSEYGPVQSGIPISSGKWYCEVVPQSSEASYLIGLTRGLSTATNEFLGSLANDVAYYGNGNLYMNGASAAAYGASYAQNDVIGMAIDLDNNTLTYYKNGASQGLINLPSPPSVSHPYYVACCHYWSAGTGTYLLRSLSSDWTGTAPTDHLAIIQDNMTSSDQFISAFSWIKNREATDNHMLFDRVRGPFKDIHSNDIVDEVTNTNTVQSFLAGGVQVGNNVEVNTVTESYVLWNWMMEATGTGSSNTDGTINTTSTLVDTTLGMSISTYVGTGSNATIGHGLGVKPGLILLKVLNIGGSAEWVVYHKDLTTGSALFLNSSVTEAASTGYFNNTQPTSTVFTVGTSTYNNSNGDNHVAYSFADSQFISIGSYTNTGNVNGTFVPTLNSLGVLIQPTWIIAKTLASASWVIFDNKRIGYNVDNNNLLADTTVIESTADKVDIVTGGFKLRTNLDPNYNTGPTTVYMAIGTPIIDTDGRIIAGR